MEEDERGEGRAERRDRIAHEVWRGEQKDAGRTPKRHVRTKPKDRRLEWCVAMPELPKHVAETRDEVRRAKEAAITAARERGKRRPRSLRR